MQKFYASGSGTYEPLCDEVFGTGCFPGERGTLLRYWRLVCTILLRESSRLCEVSQVDIFA